MLLGDFLQEAAAALAAGDSLDPDQIEETALAIQEQLESLCERPDEPLQGLESLDDALIEAASLYSEAVDLLVLAVVEDIPQLHTAVSERAQDATDTLRALRQSVELQCTMLAEETPAWE